MRVPLWVWFQAGVLILGASLGAFGTRFFYVSRLDHAQQTIATFQAESEAAKAAQKAAVAAAVEDLAKKEVQRADLEKQLKQRVATVIKKPVYRNVCLDDDGVRLANDALARRPTAPKRSAD